MTHLSSFTALNGNRWGCCAQVNLLISCICCTSLPSPQWTETVEAAVFRLICLFLIYDAPLFLHRSERKLWGCCFEVNFLISGTWCTSLPSLQWTDIVQADVLMLFYLFVGYVSPLSFTEVNGYCWGCCIQVNLLISGIWCTSLPSLQWTEIVEAAVLRLIYVFLVYFAPLYLHRSEPILLKLLWSG